MATPASAGVPLKAVAKGAGGIDELREHLDEGQVMFALLRFQFGQGTFQRTKYIAIHFNGDRVSTVKRGRMNAQKGRCKEALGATHCEVIMTEQRDATVDNLMIKAAASFVSDDDIGGGTFSIAQMKADYEAMVAAAQVKKLTLGSSGGKRRTAAEMGADFVTGEKALSSVREPLGAFNWALFKPHATHLQFENAGSLSITEMREWLKDDRVLFGIVRMGFGAGKFRRTHWLFLHWTGENCGAVKRGQANGLKGAMHKMLSPVSVDFEATSLDGFTVPVVVDKVTRSVVVDGDTKGDDSENPYTLEGFMKALEEEAKASAEMFGDTGGGSDAGTLTVEQCVKEVRDEDSATTWALFSVVV